MSGNVNGLKSGLPNSPLVIVPPQNETCKLSPGSSRLGFRYFIGSTIEVVRILLSTHLARFRSTLPMMTNSLCFAISSMEKTGGACGNEVTVMCSKTAHAISTKCLFTLYCERIRLAPFPGKYPCWIHVCYLPLFFINIV